MIIINFIVFLNKTVIGFIKYLYKDFPKKIQIFFNKMQICLMQANIFRHNYQSHLKIKIINSNIP